MKVGLAYVTVFALFAVVALVAIVWGVVQEIAKRVAGNKK